MIKKSWVQFPLTPTFLQGTTLFQNLLFVSALGKRMEKIITMLCYFNRLGKTLRSYKVLVVSKFKGIKNKDN